MKGLTGIFRLLYKKLTNISTSATTKIFNASSNPALPPILHSLDLLILNLQGTIAFDDVSINYNATSPSFVQGYNNLTVTGTSKLITGLATGTNYYYRVDSVVLPILMLLQLQRVRDP